MALIEMRLGKLRAHYGSAIVGYALAVALPILIALIRRHYLPGTGLFPFIFFYPAIFAVAFFAGPAPGIATVLCSAASIALLARAMHPNPFNWASLAILGGMCVILGAVFRTVRESAEEASRAVLRFQLVTENVSDWIFFLDANGCLDYANRSACAGLGRSFEELTGRPFADLAPEPERQHLRSLIKSSLSRPVSMEQLHLENAAREPIPVELSCTAIRTGEEILIHIACRDLRERRESERKLREARQWEALGTLAGGLAHDFNNLLTAMMGNASLAREMLPAAHETSGLLDNVLFAGAKSASLIDLMLAAAGYRRNLLVEVELRDLLASALARVKVPENVRVEAHAGSGAFPGEYASLERLVSCLLENAVESYEGRSGAVHLALELAQAPRFEPGDFEEGECEGECLRIVIEDHGSGMDPATLERAFNPFFTTKFMGRGLGLAAVRGLVRAYSGKLWIRTRPDEGTRIEVWLPRPHTQPPSEPQQTRVP